MVEELRGYGKVTFSDIYHLMHDLHGQSQQS